MGGGRLEENIFGMSSWERKFGEESQFIPFCALKQGDMLSIHVKNFGGYYSVLRNCV